MNKKQGFQESLFPGIPENLKLLAENGIEGKMSNRGANYSIRMKQYPLTDYYPRRESWRGVGKDNTELNQGSVVDLIKWLNDRKIMQKIR